jgi:hypothetical protein
MVSTRLMHYANLKRVCGAMQLSSTADQECVHIECRADTRKHRRSKQQVREKDCG